MAFDNSSNRKRADKIAELLAHVKVSADSNKSSPHEIEVILQPVFKALADLGLSAGSSQTLKGEQEASAALQSTARAGQSEASYMCIKRAAEEASLSDLTYAMAVYLNRIDEHLSE